MQYSYIKTLEPALEPITLAEAKSHLQQPFSHDDTYITSLISVARQFVETITDRSLINQAWVKRQDFFTKEICLNKAPITAITSVSYYSGGGDLQVLSALLWQADINSIGARLRPAPGASWPASQTSKMNAVQVAFTAGYGDSGASVPAALKHAILLVIRHLYDNRSVDATEKQMENVLGLKSLVADFRTGWA